MEQEEILKKTEVLANTNPRYCYGFLNTHKKRPAIIPLVITDHLDKKIKILSTLEKKRIPSLPDSPVEYIVKLDPVVFRLLLVLERVGFTPSTVVCDCLRLTYWKLLKKIKKEMEDPHD